MKDPEGKRPLPGQLAEIQGLYGAVSIGESVLQRIWAEGCFRKEGLRTMSGASLRIVSPGRWNRNEGPDFLGAEWWLGDRRVVGDVEVHFNARDWVHHGHHRDPRFSKVRLHVVLFSTDTAAADVFPEEMETLSWLKYLEEDLEGYADRFAREAVTGSPGRVIGECLLSVSPEARLERLRKLARERFERKVWFVRQREGAGSAEEVLHGLTLEVLGYPRNRAPMVEVAWRWPVAGWRAGAVPDPETLLQTVSGWKRSGMRPSSQPLTRLGQYRDLWRVRPDWMRVVMGWAAEESERWVGAGGRPTREFRQLVDLRGAASRLRELTWGEGMGDSRFHTWAVNALLPWLAAKGVSGAEEAAYHWPEGDQPDWVAEVLRQADLHRNRDWPRGNGLFQGLLGLLLERGSSELTAPLA